MRTQKTTSSSKKRTPLRTGKVLTSKMLGNLRSITKRSTLARDAVKRLQTVLSDFRARIKKLAKVSNGKTRH